MSSIACRPAADRTPPAASARSAHSDTASAAQHRRAARHGCPGACASSVRNVSTTASSQASPSRRARASAGDADLERGLEVGRVLACDPVAVGRQAHRLEQRHSRFGGNILRSESPSPPGEASRIAA